MRQGKTDRQTEKEIWSHFDPLHHIPKRLTQIVLTFLCMYYSLMLCSWYIVAIWGFVNTSNLISKLKYDVECVCVCALMHIQLWCWRCDVTLFNCVLTSSHWLSHSAWSCQPPGYPLSQGLNVTLRRWTVRRSLVQK